MKKSTYLFFFVFLSGVICANILGIASGRDLGAINSYFMNQYMYADIQGRELFLYLFYERVPEMLLLFILSIGIYGTVVVHAYICYLGFSVGFLSVISIMNYGMSGIGLMLGFFFPQWLLYLPMLGIWYHGLYLYKNQKPGIGYVFADKRKGQRMKFFIYFLLALGMLFGGIFLESYANPYLLQKIIRII